MTYPIHFRIKRCKGLDGCKQMGLDDKLASSLVENIAKQQNTSSVNNMTIHVRSSSCDLMCMCWHQHTIVMCCDMASSTNNHRGLYSPLSIPPRIPLESRNSAGLILEFDILPDCGWNITRMVFYLLCLMSLY